jgi:rubrerythrin
MGIKFNADEVFEMAEEIERNGAKFYRQAAAKSSDLNIKHMLIGLAEMEDNHLRIFQEMRTQLSDKEKEPNIYDPQNEAALYLQTMAGGKGTEGLKAPGVKLSGNETMSEILQIAIEAEKNSILFYVGLRELVPDGSKDKLEMIIKEEIRHVATLKAKLEEQ